MNDNRDFDDKLFNILQECESLPNFLDAVFGFLKRRTDFYCLTKNSNSPVGLPEGWADHFVKQAFYKWKTQNVNDVVMPNDTPVGNEVEVTEVSQEHYENVNARNFTSSESYNGAVFENYSWSQTITDVVINVRLPENVETKHLLVNILPQRITVALKNNDSTLLNGDLCKKVKHNDAIWSQDKWKLEIHLEKVTEIWWDCLVQTEPKLDITKIDCSRPFEELSEEARVKIEELTWNQERTRLGLPTSDKIIMEQKLLKSWNVEGSPFKGRPFDPSTVILN